ncbi:MAG: alpha/beta fold hydrolase [Hyphomicrobiales bacterium]|nr:alpha/beta fold hydrolase [Hyphomicrobiales bacterium]
MKPRSKRSPQRSGEPARKRRRPDSSEAAERSGSACPPDQSSADEPSVAVDSHSGFVALADRVDEIAHTNIARLTGGLSPVALLGAYVDWLSHLSFSPGKRMQLVNQAARNIAALSLAASGQQPVQRAEPDQRDRRFIDEAWKTWPFKVLQQGFLLQEQWWQQATGDVEGVTRQHEDVVSFVARQSLDTMAPSNFVLTNPEVLQRTVDTGGRNLVTGYANLVEDWLRALSDQRPVGAEKFRVGEDVAVTPGKVVYRNRLIELIQYESATARVRPEPLLIVPAWIMKFYILDLSPEHSLVRYLVDQGFTVFIISWKNPDSGDRDLGLEDYRALGIEAALAAVGQIMPRRQVHTLGYCLGGTMLAIAAAAMARDGDDRLATLGLLTAQTDFTEAGELKLFIKESQLHFLDHVMRRQGYLDERQMAWAFQMLRSNDLIWSRVVRDYLMGERRPMNDLMAWNADSTRLPYRMHSEYLRKLFLNNDIVAGRYRVNGKPIALSDIRAPIFCVGTVRDHVAPWRSVFKIHMPTDTDVTFLLTSGGHNAGIVSEPGHRGRSYQVATRGIEDPYVDPDTWLEKTPRQVGSWWPEYVAWLQARSGTLVAPPRLGGKGDCSPKEDAPGTYVFMD